MTEQPTRRNLITKIIETAFTMPISRGLELGSAAPLVLFSIGNVIQGRPYYEIDMKNSIGSNVPTSVQLLNNNQIELKSTLEELCNAYYSAYHKAHTVSRTYMDSKGHLKTRWVTEYRWEEPNNLPNHGLVYGFRDTHDVLATKCLQLAKKQVIDARDTDKLRVERREANRWLQGILSTAVYGAEVGLLLGYEELFAHFGSYENISLAEKVRKGNTPSQIGRRSVIKMLAAVVGAGAALKVLGSNLASAEQGYNSLESELGNVSDMADVKPDVSFVRYLGESPAQFISQAGVYVNASQAALQSGIADQRVAKAFEQVLLVGRSYIDNTKKMFADGIPEDLSTRTTYAYITDKLEGLNSQQQMKAGTAFLLEAGAIGGTIALIVIPAEYWNSRVAKKEKVNQTLNNYLGDRNADVRI